MESEKNLMLIGREDAQRIAIKAGGWDENLIDDKTIEAKLLHVKNDGFTFLVDEKTLEDTLLFMERFTDLQENQYVWMIHVLATGNANRQWGYLIDAENGNVLRPTQNVSEFEPTNPEITIKEGTVIRQARGNVTIVFSLSISSSQPKQTPFPAQLLITEGDTITWQNDDTIPHTVTSGYSQQEEFAGRIFDSGIIAPSKSFSFTFSNEHIDGYHYFCSIHPWEIGEIIIQRFEE